MSEFINVKDRKVPFSASVKLSSLQKIEDFLSKNNSINKGDLIELTVIPYIENFNNHTEVKESA